MILSPNPEFNSWKNPWKSAFQLKGICWNWLISTFYIALYFCIFSLVLVLQYGYLMVRSKTFYLDQRPPYSCVSKNWQLIIKLQRFTFCKIFQKIVSITINFGASFDNGKYVFWGRVTRSSEYRTFKWIYVYRILLPTFHIHLQDDFLSAIQDKSKILQRHFKWGCKPLPFTNFFDFWLRSSRYEKDLLQVLSNLPGASLLKISQMSGKWFPWHPKGVYHPP